MPDVPEWLVTLIAALGIDEGRMWSYAFRSIHSQQDWRSLASDCSVMNR